ncbi:MAG TPA: extracellular solute-binding protein [Chloroflexota bacterium]|nr:extracellular solute-binding protein [Chloroflexota bacterium]
MAPQTHPGTPAAPAAHTRRRILSTLAATTPTLAALACGQAASTGDSKSAPSQKNVTIRVVARTAQEADMWPIRIPAFMQAYPTIKVEPELYPSDIVGKINALVAAGSMGDVGHTHFSAAQPQRLAVQKAVKELDAYVAKDKLDLKQWYPAAIEAGRVDNKIIALPFKGKMGTIGFFYNQSLIEQAGLKIPDANTTINEIGEMSAKLTKPDGSQIGLAGNLPKAASTMISTIRRWNAELLSKDWMKATLDTQQARDAFSWYYDAFQKRRFMDPALPVQDTFNAGKAAFMITVDVSQEKSKTLVAGQQQGFKWGAMLAPKGPTGRRGGYWVPDAIQMFATTTAPDESWQLVKWLTNKDTGLALAQQKSPGVSTTPGARPDVYNDPAFLNHELFPRYLQELERDANLMNEPFQVPGNFKIDEFNAALGAQVDKIWKNTADPNPSFMKTLNDELQNILNLPR